MIREYDHSTVRRKRWEQQDRTNMKHWEPGQGIVMREVWRNRVYSIFPVRVVQDSGSQTALCLPRQALGLYPHTRAGIPLRIPEEDWVLDGEPWSGGDMLYLVQTSLGYTAIASWDKRHNFMGWKIDLVEPPQRTPLGFDYMDQLLDIMVSADRSTWRWKDEDEVVEAQARGIFTAEQVQDLYQRGESAVQALQGYKPPFDTDWEYWKPDPAWREPFDLPEGWERV
jgi:hypothetical protein